MAPARTQEQRRAATRAKLLAATAACLTEHGYVGTTVGRVCKRAGVSSGGLFAHFDSKAELLAATAAEILRRAREDAAADFLARDHGDPIADAVAVAWRFYRRHDLRAALELFVAGRTDPELAAHLDAVDAPHREQLGHLVRLMLPAQAGHPDFDDVVELVLATMFGLALDVGTIRSAELREREVALLTELVRHRLGGTDA
ncbi:TetR/AcrR family transcriptional regulator [Egicoccus sp. AB-alg2]|uniref:TetR/AcrR family transcriptional regulator n=1 Tax=Egicoccus sp. AB-alg2 TaxID=3242693 RepID=UPI00359F05B7